MGIYQGTITATFRKIQQVQAENIEEAREMLMGNVGNDIEETLIGDDAEITGIEEISE